jgi:hypothetical protein
MDSVSFCKLLFMSWNVRGLGDDDKCGVVRDNISDARPSVVCIQESKLAHLDAPKSRSFLPSYISDFSIVPADGSRGGIVTAWDTNILSLTSSTAKTFSLTTSLKSTSSDLSFTITNVYAPSDHSLADAFVAEMLSLLVDISGLWLILGDFNLIRHPSEKNNDNFNPALANSFNAMINSLAILELPLLDRRFTWSNGQEIPILARLDRAFLNNDWNAVLPHSALTSLPRPTSDDVPLLVTTATKIPSHASFCFENAWLLDPSFLPSTIPSWN